VSAVVKEKPEAKKRDQQQILEELANEVGITSATPKAQRLALLLKAPLPSKEDFERGRALGREEQRKAAKLRRDEWREWAIRAIIDNHDCGQYLTRAGIVSNVYADAKIFGHKGKLGCIIDQRTVAQWLSGKVEAEIRLAATHRLIQRELKRHGIDDAEA
jgi:hypothetical protein